MKYRIRKSDEAVATSLSETSVHDLYQKVQRGGDIPLEGLRCPIPPAKGIAILKSFEVFREIVKRI